MAREEVIYHLVTALLVLIFSFASAIKLVPHLIDDRYSREIVSLYFVRNGQRIAVYVSVCRAFLQVIEFSRYVSIPPASLLKLTAEAYRVLVGVVELTMVVLMLVGYQKRRLQVLTSYGLLLLMIGALYTHVMVGDPVEKMAGAGFCLVLIVVRLHVLGLFRIHLKFE